MLRQIQPSFAAGELAPAVQARVDLAKYHVGCKTLLNTFVHSHGGASNRPGTRFVEKAKHSNKKCRLLKFQYSDTQSYVIEFGHLYLRLYRDGGRLESGGSPVEVATPYTESELPQVKYAQSADVIYLVHPNHRPKTLTRYGDTNWVLADFDYKNGPFLPDNVTDTKLSASALTGNITLTATKDVFLPGHVGALFKIGHYLPSKRIWFAPNPPNWVSTQDYTYNDVVKYNGVIYFCILPVTTQYTGGGEGEGPAVPIANPAPSADPTHWDASGETNQELMAYGDWRMETVGFWTGTFHVQRYDEPTETWKTIRTFSSTTDKNYAISETVDEPTRLRIQSVSFAQSTKGGAEQKGYVILEAAATYYEGNVRITAVTDAKHASANVEKKLGSTEATEDWAEGAWSDERGWPACVAFYSDRLAFANTRHQPQTIFMSKTADYNNFGRSVPLQDDDAIHAPLLSREVNGINSMVSLSQLLALTAANEWKIGSGGNGPISPKNVDPQVQGYRGASVLDPLVIGERVLFVQNRGFAVRDLGYTLETDSYTGANLTILSKHLFEKHKIIDWAYQQEPWSIVWAVRDDGILLSLTYVREHDVWAWARHMTDGVFEAVTVIPADGYDEVWFVVKRTINGQTVRCIERMAERLPDDNVVNAYFVDCGLTYKGEPATNIYGLDHLNGATVAILADGNVIPQMEVADGKITLPFAASVVHVGLPYRSEFEPLSPEINLSDGATFGRKVRINSVVLRFENTTGGFIGPAWDKLDPIKWRTNEPYDTPVRLYTGERKMTVPASFTSRPSICFRQSDPLPFTILAVVPDLTFGDSRG